MKIFPLLFFIGLSFILTGQSNPNLHVPPEKKHRYTVWVEPTWAYKRMLNKEENISNLEIARKFRSMDEGALVQLKDASILISPSFSTDLGASDLKEWAITDIDYLSYKRKGSGGMGFVGGFLIGFVAGMVSRSGETTCSTTPFGTPFGIPGRTVCEPSRNFGTGVLLGLGGGVLGSILFSGKRKLKIGANKRIYKEQQEKLKKMVLTQ